MLPAYRRYHHGDSGSRLYNCWSHMRGRCKNPDDKAYEWYGGRGIKICSEWDDYTAFRVWALDNGYTEILTLDRIDHNGDYCPRNCQWIPKGKNSGKVAKDRRKDLIIAFEAGYKLGLVMGRIR